MSLPLAEIYDRLLEHYGPQHWWPADSPFEVMVGAVLVQSTAWRNVEHALDNLKEADALSPATIRDMNLDTLELLIRPSGFYRVKARRLKALCDFLGDHYADSIRLMDEQTTDELRDELLAVHGVGQETADDILLYALDRPIFVIDAFTRRIFHRLGLIRQDPSYAELQKLFHDHMPGDAAVYNEFHALLVRHGNTTCRNRPDCDACPLLQDCPKTGL